jgi:sodium transport system permease protein
MNMKQCWIVFRKELVDGLRDRPAVRALVLPALVGPMLFGGLITLVVDRETRTGVLLAVAGMEHAPELARWLDEQIDVEVVPAPDDPEQAVRDGLYEVVLVIEAGLGEWMSRGLAAPIKLVSDSSDSASRRAENGVRALVERYSAELASLRLMARGVAPPVVTPVRLDAVDVASPGQSTAGILTFLPVAFLFMALTGGMPVSLDATAGERERGSLEPLLLNPVSRPVLVAGKWLAASAFACTGVVLFIASTMVVLHWIPWHEFGMQLGLSDRDILSIAILILPVALLFAAAMTFLSTVSRSLKEAQGYLGLLMLGVMLLYLVSVAFPPSNLPWLAPVPIIGQFALTYEVLAGESPEVYRYVLSAAGALLAALALVTAAGRLLRRESIVFRG